MHESHGYRLADWQRGVACHGAASEPHCQQSCVPLSLARACRFTYSQAFANLQACTAAGAPTVAPPGVPPPPPVAGAPPPPPPPPPPAQGGGAVTGGTCFGFVRSDVRMPICKLYALLHQLDRAYVQCVSQLCLQLSAPCHQLASVPLLRSAAPPPVHPSVCAPAACAPMSR